MEQTKYDVFISYRRKGGSEKAQLVKSELKQRRVEDERIFLDTHSLHDGDFEQKIKVAIEQSQSIVVIISKGCFDEIKETDFWYMEIREALLQRKKVIPIFFDGISSFAAINVPQELEELTKKNAVTYQHEYADAAFDKLILFIGFQKEAHNPTKKRGCLFSLKYKGCLISVALVGFIVFISVPIALMQLGSTSSSRVLGEASPDYVEHETEESFIDVTAAGPPPSASPEEMDVELYGKWQGLNEHLIMSFRTKNVIMEKQDSGIIKTRLGEYRVNGNCIVFYWKEERTQVVRFEVVGDELYLDFEDGKMIMLIKL